jgi:O-acetyl-ADP-ribose deacetylase (regulator of RNase III)
MLNELSKFVPGPRPQGSITVTSGGDLPVHFVFHAAAIELREGGIYAVSKKSVCESVSAALKCATALNVGVLWVPLLGTGAAGLKAKESFDGILEAVRKWTTASTPPMTLLLFIYKHSLLERRVVIESIRKGLPKTFVLSETAN